MAAIARVSINSHPPKSGQTAFWCSLNQRTQATMKASLVCLLLLATVACQARKAGRASKMAERADMAKAGGASKMAERADMAKAGRAFKMAERADMAKEAREDGEAAGAELEAKAGGMQEEQSERVYPYCFGPCYGPYGEYGCMFDGCYYGFDFMGYYGPCACCAVSHPAQCGDYYYYYG